MKKYINDPYWHFRMDYDNPFPYQIWRQFHPDAIVEVVNIYGHSNIGLASDFDWGYYKGLEIEGMIWKARHLTRNNKLLYRVKAICNE